MDEGEEAHKADDPLLSLNGDEIPDSDRNYYAPTAPTYNGFDDIDNDYASTSAPHLQVIQDINGGNLLGAHTEDLPASPDPSPEEDETDSLLPLTGVSSRLPQATQDEEDTGTLVAVTEVPSLLPKQFTEDEEETDSLLTEVSEVIPASSWLRVGLSTALVTAWLACLLYCYLTITTAGRNILQKLYSQNQL